MKKEDDVGSISEWNEGNFKNLRLHEAQQLINMGKINPFGMSENGTSWNYQVWKSGIDILYGEGQSKYSEGEIDEIDNIQELIETILRIKPPFKTITEHSYIGTNNNFVPITENQRKIEKFLKLYEKKVKEYNDAHGLSTRNKDEDLKGL